MIPRTSARKHGNASYVYEVYKCSARFADINACDQAPIKRTLVGVALLDYLSTVAIDLEQTRERYKDAIQSRDREHAELLASAERELMVNQAARERAESDYLAGNLTSERWQRLDDRLTSESEAVSQQIERLRLGTRTRPADGSQDDESAILRRLSALRASVSGEIGNAGDVDALRAVLTRLFERFELRTDRGADLQADLLQGGDKLVLADAYLKPVPRLEAIVPGLHKLGWEPKKVALELDQDSDDKYSIGLPSNGLLPASPRGPHEVRHAQRPDTLQDASTRASSSSTARGP